MTVAMKKRQNKFLLLNYFMGFTFAIREGVNTKNLDNFHKKERIISLYNRVENNFSFIVPSLRMPD